MQIFVNCPTYLRYGVDEQDDIHCTGAKNGKRHRPVYKYSETGGKACQQRDQRAVPDNYGLESVGGVFLWVELIRVQVHNKFVSVRPHCFCQKQCGLSSNPIFNVTDLILDQRKTYLCPIQPKYNIRFENTIISNHYTLKTKYNQVSIDSFILFATLTGFEL